jgi:hypothetical protein
MTSGMLVFPLAYVEIRIPGAALLNGQARRSGLVLVSHRRFYRGHRDSLDLVSAHIA